MILTPNQIFGQGATFTKGMWDHCCILIFRTPRPLSVVGGIFCVFLKHKKSRTHQKPKGEKNMRKILCALLGMLLAGTSWSATLPAGYTELEYIQSTGTQYIDTGIIPNGSTKVEMVAQANYSSDLRFFGAVAGSETPLYFAAGYSVSGKWNNMYNSTNNVVSNDVTGFLADKLEHKIVKDNVLSVDGNVLNTISVASFELPVSMYLFTVNDNENPGVLRPMLIKYAKIWNNNTLVRDFIPAKNSSGVIGMYDTVSGNFFTNAGTGTFTAGRELNPCRNLFDKDTVTNNYVINISNGNLYASSGNFASSYIAVTGGKKYTLNRTIQTATNGLAWFDSNKTYISGKKYDSNNGQTFEAPANAAFVRFSIYSSINGVQFEQGDTATNYVPYSAACHPVSCKNLFDSSAFNTDVGQNVTWLHYRVPNGTYTMSTNFPPQAGQQAYTSVWVLAGNVTSGIDSATNGVSFGNPKTITVTDGWYSVAYRSGIPAIPQNPKDYNWQLEEGSTATEYVPYCANQIRIATTEYNSARFSPVVTELNDTIATIRSVVTNTINQTKAIADLQATKQTRPNENCPAGKKCLLIEDDAGQPHWYEIIENVYGLPNGYTALEYLQGKGSTHIVPGVTINSNLKIDIKYEILTPGWLLGGTTGESGRWGVTSSNTFFSGTSGVADISSATNLSGINTATFNYKTGATVNGVNIPFGTEQTYGNVTAKQFYLFSADGTGVSTQEHKIYYANIYNGETLVRSLVPAKRNSDNVLGMYDLANDVFYTNAGSGTFIAGPEI